MPDDDAGQLEKRRQIQQPIEVLLPKLRDRVENPSPDGVAPQLVLRLLHGRVVPGLQRVEVVVSEDARNVPLAQQFHTFAGMRTVAHHVAATQDVLDTEFINLPEHRFKRREIGMDVGDDCDGLHVPSLKGGCQATPESRLLRTTESRASEQGMHSHGVGE